MMAGAWARRMLRPWRRLAGRFALADFEGFIGPHGCLRTGASFVTWNQVEGDYLEFGVYRGESFAAAYHALDASRRDHAGSGFDSPEYRRWLSNPPRFFAFDSFEGLPAGSGERQVDYHPGAYGCSEREFRDSIARRGVDSARVIAVPGFYDRTLNRDTKERYGLRQAALVMIDCDLYESTVPALDFLTDLVGQGTVLIFHDWFRFKGRPDCGEQRACREWLARNTQFELIEYWREGPQAVSFLVNLKPSASR
jgi:O-methyltransferase